MKMLAIKYSEWEKSGCPNCGADAFITDKFYRSNQPTGTCCNCKLGYQIVADQLANPDIKVLIGYLTNEDGSTTEIMECPIIIPHPRKGLSKWKWMPKDEGPINGGERVKSRGAVKDLDLAVFLNSKQSGERILSMVKEVLNIDKPKSWLDWRDSERMWIQFKIDDEEFDVCELDNLIKQNKGILLKEYLYKTRRLGPKREE